MRVWAAETGKMRFMLQGFTAYLGSVQVGPSWLLADGTNNAITLLDFAEEDEPSGTDQDEANGNAT